MNGIRFQRPTGATAPARRRGLLLAAVCCAVAAVPAARAEPAPPEARLIDALIDGVAKSSHLVFLRNGSTATAAEAAQLLRGKYAHFRDEIATAEDFIRLCGTKSSMSGQAYAVRLPDGSVRPAATLLTERLRELRGKAAPAAGRAAAS